MAKLIVICVVGLLGLAAIIAIAIAARGPRPSLPRRDRELIDDAMSLLRKLRSPTNLDRIDVLCEESKTDIDKVLDRYHRRFP